MKITREILELSDSNDAIVNVEAYLVFLQEKSKSKKTTITRVTRQTKIDRAIGALATKFAKETNDPMYKKMKKFRDKFFKFRDRIKAKYGPRVRSRAISGQGISDLIRKDKKKDKKK